MSTYLLSLPFLLNTISDFHRSSQIYPVSTFLTLGQWFWFLWVVNSIFSHYSHLICTCSSKIILPFSLLRGMIMSFFPRLMQGTFSLLCIFNFSFLASSLCGCPTMDTRIIPIIPLGFSHLPALYPRPLLFPITSSSILLSFLMFPLKLFKVTSGLLMLPYALDVFQSYLTLLPSNS